MEKTLGIIKPDAVERNCIGEILKTYEEHHFRIRALQMKNLNHTEAQEFYAEHRGKPFYESLVSYMTSGPVVILVLEADNAIESNRKIMGATDPKKAEAGTIRKKFAQSIERNSIHGSDSKISAQREIQLFFPHLV